MCQEDDSNLQSSESNPFITDRTEEYNAEQAVWVLELLPNQDAKGDKALIQTQ
jgi:hypothetical protein